MKKEEEIKKNHHYVWANYLLRWSNNNRDLYYTKKNGGIAQDSVKSRVVAKHFYKVEKLQQEHVDTINYVINKSGNYLQKKHTQTLDSFMEFQRINEKYKDEELTLTFHAKKSNALENLHTGHENSVMQIMKSLSNRDISILESKDNKLAFTRFIGHQITRTKSFKDKIINKELEFSFGSDFYKNMQHCWWIISYILGTNIGHDLYETIDNDTFSLLINNSSVPFITGDQPVIYINKDITSFHGFYYPISPNIAICLDESNTFKSNKIEINDETANILNKKIAESSNIHIFGKSIEDIINYQKHVGSKINTFILSRKHT